jgi:hypothetical protein
VQIAVRQRKKKDKKGEELYLRVCICVVHRRRVRPLLVLPLVQVHVKNVEDQPEHGRPQPVAQPPHPRHHPLHHPLPIRRADDRDERRDRRIRYRAHGSEHPRRPHHPSGRAEAVPQQLQHLEEQTQHDGVLAPEILHEGAETELGEDGEQADKTDEDGHHRRTPSHHQLEVDEDAAVLARFGEVRQEHGDAQEEDRGVLADVTQGGERIGLFPADGGDADLLGEAFGYCHQDEEHVQDGHGCG